jgi:hypothetical protein
MANGRKNYFRHSAAARLDEKIVNLISKHGKEAYFHYFALLEMCAQKALSEDMRGDETFIFHKRTVCGELMVTPQRLGRHLLAIQSSLLGDLVETPEGVKIRFPNLPKYLGRYETKKHSKPSNKRKEKEIKEKERDIEKQAALDLISPDELTQTWNDVLSIKLGYSHGIGVGEHLRNFLDARQFFDTPEKWRDYFVKISKEPFLLGENDKNWKATLQWAVNYDNALKVLDGAYDKSSSVKKALDAVFGPEELS